MKSVLVGSVSTSQVVQEELMAAGCPSKMVFSLDETVG